jgi:4-hydroxy-4-methyl-2-oxoglutarate aldolase
VSDVATRLRAVPAAVVSDVLDGLGLRDQLLPHGIGPLAPGQTVCGPAFPIAGRTDTETAPEAGLRRYLEMLGHVPHGHVVVMAAGDETAAHFGELSATWVQARDCPGVVIDGGLRDIPVLRRMGYPIFCRYHSTRSIAGRWAPVSMGDPVEIGGVAIAQGDLIVGDDDGVVVVPAAVADEVASRGEAIVGAENHVRNAVATGTPPIEAYDRWGSF